MAEQLASDAPSASTGEAEVLFARQPILDVQGRLAGYELLYRGEGSESPHAATSRVAASALSDLGLRSATGGAPAFINVTTEFLMAMDPLPFGPEGVVLEIAADRVPDEPLIERPPRPPPPARFHPRAGRLRRPAWRGAAPRSRPAGQGRRAGRRRRSARRPGG